MAKTKKKVKQAPLKLLLLLCALLGGLFIWASFQSMDDYLDAIPASDFCADTYKTSGEVKNCAHTMFDAVDKDRQGAQALGISGAALAAGSLVLLFTLPPKRR